MQIEASHHRSELGDWSMTIARAELVRQYVSLLWDVRGTVAYSRESILPSGHVEILFNLGDDQFLLDPDDFSHRTRYDTAWISGLQQRNMIVESVGFSHLVGVRFTALGAWRFFGLPMEEIRDRVVDADLVLGKVMLRLRSELQAIAPPEARLGLLLQFVMRRIDEGPEVHSALRMAVGRIVAKRGAVAISSLVDLAGCSHRHLVHKFREQIGVGPKRFSELLRLQRAAETLKRRPTMSLADLALDCGYYDQSHFNRAFRQFAGVSPGTFVTSILPDEVTESMVLG